MSGGLRHCVRLFKVETEAVIFALPGQVLCRSHFMINMIVHRVRTAIRLPDDAPLSPFEIPHNRTSNPSEGDLLDRLAPEDDSKEFGVVCKKSQNPPGRLYCAQMLLVSKSGGTRDNH
jgi:hypothetical protein